MKDLRVQQDQRVRLERELPVQPVALVPRAQLAWLVKLALRAQQDQKVQPAPRAQQASLVPKA